MRAHISAWLLFSLAIPAHAADIAMEDQSQIRLGAAEPASRTYFQPPQESDLPDNAFGKLVQEGRAIFVDTRNRAPEYVGNGLSCANCHLEQGRKANSAPLWGGVHHVPGVPEEERQGEHLRRAVTGVFSVQHERQGTGSGRPGHCGPLGLFVLARDWGTDRSGAARPRLPGSAEPRRWL